MSKSELIGWLILLLIICVITIWRMRKRIKELEQLSSNYFRLATSEYQELIQENFKMVALHRNQEGKIRDLEGIEALLKAQLERCWNLARKEAPDG